MTNQNSTEYESATPLNVEANEASQTLFINWSDGHTTQYPIEWLRWECPCALCRGEMGLPGRLSQVSELKPDEKRLETAVPIGNYAIMFYWGDGHHDGIYTYDFLRVNCHCPECTARHGTPEGSYGYKNLTNKKPDEPPGEWSNV